MKNLTIHVEKGFRKNDAWTIRGQPTVNAPSARKGLPTTATVVGATKDTKSLLLTNAMSDRSGAVPIERLRGLNPGLTVKYHMNKMRLAIYAAVAAALGGAGYMGYQEFTKPPKPVSKPYVNPSAPTKPLFDIKKSGTRSGR